MPREEMSTGDVKEIQDDMEYWKGMEQGRWHLISFTEKKSARFGWVESGQYRKYVTITSQHIEFFQAGEAA